MPGKTQTFRCSRGWPNIPWRWSLLVFEAFVSDTNRNRQMAEFSVSCSPSETFWWSPTEANAKTLTNPKPPRCDINLGTANSVPADPSAFALIVLLRNSANSKRSPRTPVVFDLGFRCPFSSVQSCKGYRADHPLAIPRRLFAKRSRFRND